MRIIKPSIEFFGTVPTDYAGTLKFIEIAGRTCYKSEDKITPDSAEKFVRKLIKARHLAMVEHSNFVVRYTEYDQGFDYDLLEKINLLAGKYLRTWTDRCELYVGGNLTAWYHRGEEVGWPQVFWPFIGIYGRLFNVSRSTAGKGVFKQWELVPVDEIPQELHRYSARFICDRGVSHELVRHRPCSFAQESTRYVNYTKKDIEFIEPAGYESWTDAQKYYFTKFCRGVEAYYESLIFSDKFTPQQARAILPNALKTEVVVTADLAEWQHIFKLRCHKSAHPDMQRVMGMLKEKFIKEGIISEQ